MSLVLKLRKILDEIFLNATERDEYEVQKHHTGSLAFVYHYRNGKLRSWVFDEQENLSVECVRRRIKGRHNVRSAFKS